METFQIQLRGSSQYIEAPNEMAHQVEIAKDRLRWEELML